MIFITIIHLAVYSGLIIYYRQSWLQIPTFSDVESGSSSFDTHISVIIPARNEQKNINSCLDRVTDQSYPNNLYEVIVIDDFSTDETAEIVKTFSGKNVQLISLEDHLEEGEINSYKKKAIEVAIKHATGELIITTDGDCIVQHKWLETIAAYYQKNNAAFIAAPVSFYGENNFLKIFQSLDFMTLQGITGASVYKKFHSMCNGANLAYEKKVFIEVNGFKDIDHIASGDDMLLMHKIFDKYPGRVHFLKSSNAIVKTKAAESIQAFFNQRIRWASKADKYSDKRITVVLFLVYFLNLWILFLGIFSIFHAAIITTFIIALVVKTIVELTFLYPVATFFGKTNLLWWFPVAQPFHILYTVIAGWLGKFGSYKWKERKVK